jgi:hypothetical protein
MMIQIVLVIHLKTEANDGIVVVVDRPSLQTVVYYDKDYFHHPLVVQVEDESQLLVDHAFVVDDYRMDLQRKKKIRFIFYYDE